MFEHSEKRLADMIKFEAKVHGAEIKEDAASSPQPKPDKPRNAFLFGDPDAYKDMPQEEREKLTNQMMNRHQIWVQEKKPMGGKQARMG